MNEQDVQAFLTMLATERRVSASTHKQALSALLFLYREVLGVELPWMQQLERPTTPKRIPTVLTSGEIVRLLGAMEGTTALVARLLYGTGMRLNEALACASKTSTSAAR
jgi:site-specific recombinase XerD